MPGHLPTGISGLDAILGPGLPFGTLVEIGGGRRTGKTTLALHIVTRALELGYHVAYATMAGRADHVFPGAWRGPPSLSIRQDTLGRDGMDWVARVIRQGVRLIVVDNLTDLASQLAEAAHMADRLVVATSDLGPGSRRVWSFGAMASTVMTLPLPGEARVMKKEGAVVPPESFWFGREYQDRLDAIRREGPPLPKVRRLTRFEREFLV